MPMPRPVLGYGYIAEMLQTASDPRYSLVPRPFHLPFRFAGEGGKRPGIICNAHALNPENSLGAVTL